MSKILITMLFAGLAGAAFAQESEVREVGTFRGIGAAEGIDVFLRHGDRESVRVEVSGNTELHHVITEVSGTYLKIHLREGRFRRNVNAKVFVTYRELDRIYASSAANVYSENVIRARDLEIGCASAASVALTIEVDEVEAEVSSAGDVELKGKANRVEFSVSSAGEIDAYDLQAGIATVNCSSAGSAKVNVLRELYAEATSGASIRFRGNPAKSRTDSRSGGSVRKSY